MATQLKPRHDKDRYLERDSATRRLHGEASRVYLPAHPDSITCLNPIRSMRTAVPDAG